MNRRLRIVVTINFLLSCSLAFSDSRPKDFQDQIASLIQLKEAPAGPKMQKALLEACYYGDYSSVQKLVAYGVNIHVRIPNSIYGETCLAAAAVSAHDTLSVLQFLVSKKVNIDQVISGQEIKKTTALVEAISAEAPSSSPLSQRIEILLKARANLNYETTAEEGYNAYSYTPLTKIEKLLLDSDCFQQMTPKCKEFNNTKQLLLDAGASLRVCRLSGKNIDPDLKGLNVRASPNGKILGLIKKGGNIFVTGQQGDWLRIELVSSDFQPQDTKTKTGWIHKNFFSARGRFLGTPAREVQEKPIEACFLDWFYAPDLKLLKAWHEPS